ncbi:FecR domain-containing protein [Pigmentiphaga sp. GD03639]|uniref:FecR domain-containing protein n=1 Tax=Pigmentiphaga sp. GD03639 TaxID=2975354 RepID=UPI002449F8CF|nr:FecR domain-containing protein [Pigmentiphaga sp. GD03639]MDH2236560.1 FecR domain-containing protein [Pigmentiphaga sp. GD03639]
MTAVDARILDEAAHWLARRHASDFSESEHAELMRWRGQSAIHEHVWQQAERLKERMSAVPAPMGMAVLGRPRRAAGRRQFLKTAALALGAPALGWLAYRRLPWQAWNAEFRTATGERRSVTLADGSRILLNTATAVSADFDGTFRRVRQHAGEILVETAHSARYADQPFIVQTGDGEMQALGTRFIVRMHEQGTTLSVLDGAVGITSARSAQRTVVQAGERAEFDSQAVRAVAALPSEADAWTHGVLYAHDMRLEDFLAELARYRPGVLQCAPDAADLRVSGSFQVNDTARVLDLLTRTLPVRTEERTRYWVRVARR